MFIGANSRRTGIPNLGCSGEGNFVQCKTAQLCYTMTEKMAQLGFGPWASCLCGYRFLRCSALMRHLPCFSSAR